MARRSATAPLASSGGASGSTEPLPCRVPGSQLLGERVGLGEPAYVVRRRNGREVRLSHLHYLIVACADGHRTPEELAAEVSTRYGLPASAGDVLRIIERRLMPAGLVQLRPGPSRRESARGALALATGVVVVLLAIAGLVGGALIAWPGESDGGGARPGASARPDAGAPPKAADGSVRVPARSAEEPAAAFQPEPNAAPPPAPISTGEARSLNDSAFALMREGRYAEAIPDLRLAVAGLAGTGPAEPYEAYANYNLGRSLLELGRCAEARPPLERSDVLQDRGEVAEALAEVDRCLAEGES